MFSSELKESDALVLVNGNDSKINSGIHMLFVPFDLGVIWVNSDGVVVDKVVAKPWALSYTPQAPAKFVIELHPSHLSLVEINDVIQFENLPLSK